MRNRACVESEMTEEMRFHLDSYVEDLCRKGFPRAEAMRRAGLEFGGMEARKEECRESLGLPLWDEMRGIRDNCGSSTGACDPAAHQGPACGNFGRNDRGEGTGTPFPYP
jgi:hypothetical protein